MEKNLPEKVEAEVANNVKKDQSQPEESKETWGKGLEYLMSCIAMSVGLGNVWRFPFTAYENGGGAFLIPYLIVLVILGRPLYYFEMVLGQFSGKGNVRAFKSMAPAFRGIGYGGIFSSFATCLYYSALMGVTLLYFVNSFTSDLPWSRCNPDWVLPEGVICVGSGETQQPNMTYYNRTTSSAEQYYLQEILREKSSIDDGIGTPEWRLTLAIFITWLLAFLIISRGIQTSGKAAYFLALFPYVVLIILLVRAVTLEGSADGIYYFIKPDWNRILEAKVWYAAVVQCFFSLDIGFGSTIMYASYNRFGYSIFRDSFVVTTLDAATSILAGFTIFGILGNLAYSLDVEVKDVINSGGTGVAFISYPEAIAKMDTVPWLFAIMFFVMLYTLGMGSLIGLQSCSSTVLREHFPKLKKWHVAAGTAAIGFLLSLPFITPGGSFVLTLVDHFLGTFNAYVIAIVEIVAVLWIYGVEKFCLDIEFMFKSRVDIYLRFIWSIIAPILMLVIFIYFLATLEPLTNGSAEYPDYVMAIGWTVSALGMLQVLIWFVPFLIKNRSSGFVQAFKDGFSNKGWQPQDQSVIEEWREFKRKTMEERKLLSSNWLHNKLLFLIGK